MNMLYVGLGLSKNFASLDVIWINSSDAFSLHFSENFLSVEDTKEPDQGNQPTKYNKKLIGEKGMQVEEKG